MYEYGVRWLEFNKKDQLVMKEKTGFKTEKALNKFIEKLTQKTTSIAFMQFVNN